MLWCAQHSLEQPEGLHLNTPSNVGVPPPGLPLASLVLSISIFKPSLKFFPWALVTQQSMPLLPGQADWVIASPCTPFHANSHKNCSACSLALFVRSLSFFDPWQGLATIALVLPKSLQLLWCVLWFPARSLCFPESPPAEEFSGVLQCLLCWHWSCWPWQLSFHLPLSFFSFHLPHLLSRHEVSANYFHHYLFFSLMKNGRIKIIFIFNPAHPIDNAALWGSYKYFFKK